VAKSPHLRFNKPKKFDAITSEVSGRGLQADLIFVKRSFGGGKFTSRASGEKYVRGGKNYQVGSNLIAYLNVGRAARARCMNFFPKIYEIPRTLAARALCASLVPVNSTVVV
jgi:hypothetical protein